MFLVPTKYKCLLQVKRSLVHHCNVTCVHFSCCVISSSEEVTPTTQKLIIQFLYYLAVGEIRRIFEGLQAECVKDSTSYVTSDRLTHIIIGFKYMENNFSGMWTCSKHLELLLITQHLNGGNVSNAPNKL